MEGLSTRRIEDLFPALGCEGISKTQVSRIVQALDAFGRLLLQPPPRRPLLSLPVAGCTDPEGACVRNVNVSVAVATGVIRERKWKVPGSTWERARTSDRLSWPLFPPLQEGTGAVANP